MAAVSARGAAAGPAAAQHLEPLTQIERVAVASLAAAYRRLVRPNAGRPEPQQSDKGAEGCDRFLRNLENTAHMLGIEPAPRDYREAFTLSYRSLFRAGTRSYRVDILEAGSSLDQHPVIWANGEAYEMSSDAMQCSAALQEAWAGLCSLLDSWMCPLKPLPLSTLVTALVALDTAWADFERIYITELMGVQLKARGLVAAAVEAERRLARLEAAHPFEVLGQLPAYQAEKRALVACLARLNSVANFQRKGRDDLSVAVLDAAADLLDRCSAGGAAGAALAPARALAERVVDSFDDLRDYLRKIERHLELLHPQLCQNPGLVDRLVRLEEAWEVGARYLCDEQVLSALCRVVPELRLACRLEPALARMLEDADAELFLILPRLALLCLLAAPARPLELVRRLLPHRFEPHPGVPTAAAAARRRAPARRGRSDPDLGSAAASTHVEPGPWLGPELLALTEQFWYVELLLDRCLPPSPPARMLGLGSRAWQELVRRAVLGPGAASSPPHGGGGEEEDYRGGAARFPAEPDAVVAAAAVEDLMRELERWSMELQRHCAEGWNECVGVLVQCLHTTWAHREALEFAI